MSLHDVVKALAEKRDLTEESIELMSRNSNAKYCFTGKPRIRVLLYPPNMDFVQAVDPLFDSDVHTQTDGKQPTIAEKIQTLGSIHEIIEDDFLELPCEVAIEFDKEDVPFEEIKKQDAIRRSTYAGR